MNLFISCIDSLINAMYKFASKLHVFVVTINKNNYGSYSCHKVDQKFLYSVV